MKHLWHFPYDVCCRCLVSEQKQVQPCLKENHAPSHMGMLSFSRTPLISVMIRHWSWILLEEEEEEETLLPLSSSSLVHAAAFASSPQYNRHGWPGFALTSNFLYFTGSVEHIPETKSAIGLMYRLLFCLTGSKQQQKTQRSERGMCFRWGREHGVY